MAPDNEFMTNSDIGIASSRGVNPVHQKPSWIAKASTVQEATGYEAGKQIKAQKQFSAVETFGLLLGIFVTAASATKREGAKTLLEHVKQLDPAVRRLA